MHDEDIDPENELPDAVCKRYREMGISWKDRRCFDIEERFLRGEVVLVAIQGHFDDGTWCVFRGPSETLSQEFRDIQECKRFLAQEDKENGR